MELCGYTATLVTHCDPSAWVEGKTLANEKEERQGREKVTKWYELQRRVFVLFFKRRKENSFVCKEIAYDMEGMLHEGQEDMNKHSG